MLEEIDKKIEGRLQALTDEISYQINALNEIQCNIYLVQYLLYLREKISETNINEMPILKK